MSETSSYSASQVSLGRAVNRKKALNLGSQDFAQHKYEYYTYLREHLPVAKGRVAMLKIQLVSRYADCMDLVKDPRFARNLTQINGGRRIPFPVPKSIEMLALSMIVEDDPEHRRLRNLVQKAFAPKSLAAMQGDMENMAHTLMDAALAKGSVDLQKEYALHIPSAVIARMIGIEYEEMPRFQNSMRVLSSGLSGWSILRTMFWDLRKTVGFLRELIARKRRDPGDDILSRLIEAEENGDQLSENELLSMLFLLIVAGYETTVHLISNGVITLLEHPHELARLRANPELAGSAVEEILRYLPPVQGTKMNFARQDIEIAGVMIRQGEPVMPLLGSANRDPAMFPEPDVFDITRDSSKHLSFSQGNHFCLGAFLARMEAKVALQVLLERSANLRLAVPSSDLQVAAVPGWHRYTALPVHST